MLSALALMSISTARRPAVDPILLPCKIGSYVVVDISLNKHAYHVAIDTSQEESYASDEFLKQVNSAPGMAFSFGPYNIPALDFSDPKKDDGTLPPKVDAVLGMKALSPMTFGVDYPHQLFAIWPSGTAPQDFEPWGWQGGAGSTVVLTEMSNTTCAYLPSDFGWLLLDDTDSGIVLPRVSDLETTYVDTGITNRASYDYYGTLNIRVAPKFETPMVSIESVPVFISSTLEKDYGIISCRSFCTRFVMSGANHVFAFSGFKDGADEYRSLMTTMFQGNSEFQGDDLYLQATQFPDSSKPEATKAKVLSIAGIQLADMVQAYRKHDSNATTMLKTIIRGCFAGCKAQILHNGQKIDIDLNVGATSMFDGIAF
jgi:hypothetical protein